MPANKSGRSQSNPIPNADVQAATMGNNLSNEFLNLVAAHFIQNVNAALSSGVLGDLVQPSWTVLIESYRIGDPDPSIFSLQSGDNLRLTGNVEKDI